MTVIMSLRFPPSVRSKVNARGMTSSRRSPYRSSPHSDSDMSSLLPLFVGNRGNPKKRSRKFGSKPMKRIDPDPLQSSVQEGQKEEICESVGESRHKSSSGTAVNNKRTALPTSNCEGSEGMSTKVKEEFPKSDNTSCQPTKKSLVNERASSGCNDSASDFHFHAPDNPFNGGLNEALVDANTFPVTDEEGANIQSYPTIPTMEKENPGADSCDDETANHPTGSCSKLPSLEQSFPGSENKNDASQPEDSIENSLDNAIEPECPAKDVHGSQPEGSVENSLDNAIESGGPADDVHGSQPEGSIENSLDNAIESGGPADDVHGSQPEGSIENSLDNAIESGGPADDVHGSQPEGSIENSLDNAIEPEGPAEEVSQESPTDPRGNKPRTRGKRIFYYDPEAQDSSEDSDEYRPELDSNASDSELCDDNNMPSANSDAQPASADGDNRNSDEENEQEGAMENDQTGWPSTPAGEMKPKMVATIKPCDIPVATSGPVRESELKKRKDRGNTIDAGLHGRNAREARVIKLMRMTNPENTTEAEAARGLRLVEKLLRQYNLNEMELRAAASKSAEQVDLDVGVVKVRLTQSSSSGQKSKVAMTKWIHDLAQAVCVNFEVRSFFNSGPSVPKSFYSFHGLKINSQLAAYAFAKHFERIQIQAEKFCNNNIRALPTELRIAKRNYMEGISARLLDKMKEAEKARKKEQAEADKKDGLRQRNLDAAKQRGEDMCTEYGPDGRAKILKTGKGRPTNALQVLMTSAPEKALKEAGLSVCANRVSRGIHDEWAFGHGHEAGEKFNLDCREIEN